MSVCARWCFTLNNPGEADTAAKMKAVAWIIYGVVGKEAGEAGTPHLQGYLEVHFFFIAWVMERSFPNAPCGRYWGCAPNPPFFV